MKEDPEDKVWIDKRDERNERKDEKKEPEARPEGAPAAYPLVESVPGSQDRGGGEDKNRDEPMEEDEGQREETAEIPIPESENEDDNILYGLKMTTLNPKIERAAPGLEQKKLNTLEKSLRIRNERCKF